MVTGLNVSEIILRMILTSMFLLVELLVISCLQAILLPGNLSFSDLLNLRILHTQR